MSYKEYAMGMSFRLNPKNIRKDTFLVPFEGLSREQEMYDTYVSPLAASDEELVAQPREGFKDGPNLKMGFKGTTELAYDIVGDENLQSFIKKEIGDKKFSKLEFSDAKPYGVGQRENRPLFRAVKSAAKKYKLIEEARVNPENVRYGQFMSMTSGIPGSTGGEFATKSLAEVLDIEENLSNELSKILKKQDDSLIPSRAELGRKYKIADSTVEKIIRDYFGDEVYEKKFNPIASKQRLVGNDKLLYDTIVDLDTISAKSLSKDLGWSQKKTNETMVSLLNKIYVKRGTGVSSFLPDDYPLLAEVVDKIRSAPDFEDVYQRRISSLVLDAYPTNSKADMAAKKLIKNKLGEYWKVTGELKKQFPQLAANLDHVIPFTFLQEVEAGKNPLNLIRVKPVPQITNKFKIIFDKARTDNIKALNANPNNKEALNQYKALKKLEKTLPFDVGGTSKSGKILDWKALPISEADLLDDLNKFPQVYNDTLSYIDKVKTDPNLQKLFIESGIVSKDQPKSKQFKFTGLSQYKPLDVKEQTKYNALLTDLIDKSNLTQKERNTINLARRMNNTAGMSNMFDKELINSTVNDFVNVAKKISSTTGIGLKVIQGILIGSGIGEITLALGLEGAAAGYALTKGASLKEALASTFLGSLVLDIDKIQIDELVESGKQLGYNDAQLKDLKEIATQFKNQKKIQDTADEIVRAEEKLQQNENPEDALKLQAEINSGYEDINKLIDSLNTFKKTFDKKKINNFIDFFETALSRQVGTRTERLRKAPEDIYPEGGLTDEQLKNLSVTPYKKTALDTYGFSVPESPYKDYILEEVLKMPEQKFQEKIQQEKQAAIEAEQSSNPEDFLLQINEAYNQGKQGFKKGGTVQRQGFADGPKMPRRGFLGLLAGLGTYIASLPFFKPTTKIGKEVLKQAPKVKGTPDWFPLLTDEIVKKGKDITAKAAIEDGQIVKMIEVDGDEVTGVFNRDGSIEVNVQSGDGAFEQPYTLRYDPPRADYDPNSGLIKQPGNFTVLEESPYSVVTGDPKNPDFDYEFDVDEADFGFHLSDTTRLEKHVTGKPERLIRNKTGQMPGSNNPDPVDVLVNKYGDYDDTIPDDYYD